MTPLHGLMTLIPLAYLLGSVPFGLVVGRANGIDPRTSGSGNIGATNVGRLLGRKFFFLVFSLDLLKSFIPMLIASVLVYGIDLSQRDRLVYLLWLGVGAGAILGHMFSIFLKFRGGKGVASSAGVMLGLIPYYTLPGVLGIIVFLLTLKTARYVSLASCVGAGSFPIFYLAIGVAAGWPLLGAQLPLLVFGIFMVSLIIFRHRANISRIYAGTEPRVGSRPA